MAGASLGGWFAARLAQKRYATDILNERLAYVTIFQHTYENTISALAKLIEQTDNYYEIRRKKAILKHPDFWETYVKRTRLFLLCWTL